MGTVKIGLGQAENPILWSGHICFLEQLLLFFFVLLVTRRAEFWTFLCSVQNGVWIDGLGGHSWGVPLKNNTGTTLQRRCRGTVGWGWHKGQCAVVWGEARVRTSPSFYGENDQSVSWRKCVKSVGSTSPPPLPINQYLCVRHKHKHKGSSRWTVVKKTVICRKPSTLSPSQPLFTKLTWENMSNWTHQCSICRGKKKLIAQQQKKKKDTTKSYILQHEDPVFRMMKSLKNQSYLTITKAALCLNSCDDWQLA